MGDIGKPLRRIELEPLPDDVPVREPAPAAVPAAPVPVPA
jgi:hypothetical protein